MDASEIVERIMYAHWDMAACKCWICTSGREDDERYRMPPLPPPPAE